MSTNSTLNLGNVVSGSAALPAAVNSTYFYARWTGFLIPTVTGLHTIGVNCEDGCNLYIGKQAIISDLSGSDVAHSSPAYTESGQIMLTAGVYYELTVEWAHGGGASYQMQLLWTPPLGSLAVIPSTSLSTSSTSVSGNLAGAWWNGTSTLYYPTGGAIADPSSSGVLARGSMPPSLCPAFTYTSTTTTITISWGANTAVYRMDGSITIIGAGSQEITGLTASTTYNFFPIYDEVLQELRFITSTDLTTSPSFIGATISDTADAAGYIETTTSLTQPANFSIEMWFVSNVASPGQQPMLSLMSPRTTGSPADNSFYLICDGGAPAAGFYCAGSVLTQVGSSSNFNDSQMHHIVVTWNNTTFVAVMYIDGVQVGTTTGTEPLASLSGMYWHLGLYWNSVIDIYGEGVWLSNVAIYHGTILTAAQAASDYSTGKNLGQSYYAAAVKANGATYFWELQETSGTTAADSVGSNTGTYVSDCTLGVSYNTHSAAGSPAIAWTQNTFLANQAQVLQSRVPLSSGAMQVTTPASGSGTPGSGGGTGGGGRQVY
jgi:hypothetical protein